MSSVPPPPNPPPPPPPFTSPPPAVASNSYRSARQTELDALRRKGLAKIFNRHFTSASEAIAREREAADLALADIVQRKEELARNPKSFEGDGGLSLTQLDQLHMELQRRKTDVHRKERETQELYRRYVSQYGGNESLAQTAMLKHSTASSAPRRSSIYSGTGAGNGMVSNMPVLHEDEGDIVRQTDLLMNKMMEKKNVMTSPARNSNVGNMAKKLEDGSFYEKQTTSTTPLSSNYGGGRGESWLKDSEFQSGPDTRASDTRSPDARAPDVKASTYRAAGSFSPGPSGTWSTPGLAPSSVSGQSNYPPPDTTTTATPEEGDAASGSSLRPSSLPGSITNNEQTFVGEELPHSPQNSEDGDSILSALTSIDGATVAEAEWRLTEFLKSETESIRLMLSSTENYDSDDYTNRGDLSTAASIESKRAAEAAKAAEVMAKQMAEASAWMKNPTVLDNDSDNENEEKKTGSLAGCEWHAYWSEEHEREYYYHANTNQTCWTKPRGVEIDFSTSKKPGSGGASARNDDDNDGVVVKDYTKSSSSVASNDYSERYQQDRGMQDNLAMIDEFRPDAGYNDSGSVMSGGSGMRSSKVLEYRRMRARRRKRRIRLMVVIAGLTSGATYIYRENWMPLLGMETASQKRANEERLRLEAEAIAARKLEEEETRRRELAAAQKAAKEEKKRKEVEAARAKKAEEERKKKEKEAALKAAEAAKKALEEKKRKEAEDRKRELQALKQAEEERKRKEAEAAAERERIRKEIEAQIREEERKKLEAEAAERRRLEAEATERRRLEAEAAERRRLEAEAAERRRLEAEAAERRRLEAEAAERRRLEAEAAERRRLEAEAAEKRRLEAEAAERRRLEAEAAERRRLEAEAAEKRRLEAEEAERKRLEAEAAIAQRVREEEEARLNSAIISTGAQDNDLIVFDENFKTPLPCKMPFSHLFSRGCRMIAKKKPVFDLKNLVDSMMQ